MITAFIISVFSTAVVSFVAGAKYGRAAQAKIQSELNGLRSDLTRAEQAAIEKFRKL